MSLTVAYNTARSSLMNTSGQIAVSGKNVAGASDPTYSRKSALTTTTMDGSARLLSVSRATDVAVYNRMLGATSATAHHDALLSGIERIESQTIGDAEDGWSPAALLGELDSALEQYANAPDNEAFAQNVVTKANALATGLNTATDAVQEVRAQADADMAASVTHINELLAKFQTLNDAVVKGSALGTDVTDEMDARDAIVTELSEELGVEFDLRDNNDMALYTDSGVTLFDKTARSVTFTATTAYGTDTVGGSVYVDGIAVAGPLAATMEVEGGKLAGLATLRDDVAVTYQNQLDEIARALIDTFAETGGDGLFTSTGTSGGLAGRIVVNAAVDPEQGGDLDALRDGDISGGTSPNTDDADSYSDWLFSLSDALAATQTFDADADLSTSQSLADFASSSIGWLEGKRSTLTTDVEYQSTLLSTTSTALSNSTGVNLDDEYARQLQLENAYEASAKLMTIVQELYDTLFEMVE